MKPHTAKVITCSDSTVRGTREDRSGPALAAMLRDAGFEVTDTTVVRDDVEAIAGAIVDAVDRKHVRLVVTTGGTGISPRDVTPEATMQVAHKKIDGFGELMRAHGLVQTPMAALSRSQAAVRGTALVVNVPGSPKGATDSLAAILHLIPHALELLSPQPVEQHPE